jgi:hypothetical protein
MRSAEEDTAVSACKPKKISALTRACRSTETVTCQGAVSARPEIHRRYSQAAAACTSAPLAFSRGSIAFLGYGRYSKRRATRGSIRVARRAGT